MKDNAAMQADYCDFKIIKTRKVVQIVLEIPQEAGDAFIAAFGLPRSDKNVPVAIAKLDLTKHGTPPSDVYDQFVRATEDGPNTTRTVKGGELARRAGIICGEPAFHQFLSGQYHGWLFNAQSTPEWLRNKCNISSRAELDHNPEAARKFNDLMAEYNAWRSHG